MSTTVQPAAARTRLARSWSLIWRIGGSAIVGAVVFVVVYGMAIEAAGTDDATTIRLGVRMLLDVLVAPVAIGLLALRRHPVAAATSVALSAFSVLSIGAGALAAVSFAARQSLRRVLTLGAVFVGLTALAVLLFPDPDFPWWGDVLGAAVVYALLALVGRYLRSRRELVRSLQAQAASSLREQRALADSARTAERARIAREMHDALGHRLSVIAMHAGALESRSDLSTADTQLAAGVVRESAQHAMNDLRDVLGVLDEPSSVRSDGSDVPALADLDALLAAGIGEGVVPVLRWEIDPSSVPPSCGRHLYRIAQEALTNVRKHAPGQPTEVVVSGRAGKVELVVRNRLSPPVTETADGSGRGLTGLAERARLTGGSFTAGVEGADFVVRAVLPCPS